MTVRCVLGKLLHMNTIYAILLLLAVVCFALAAYFTRPGNATHDRHPLMFVAIGLALFAAPFMIQQFDKL